MSARRGVFVFVLLIVLIGAAAVLYSLTSRTGGPVAPSSMVLDFDVPSNLEECEMPFGPFSFAGFRSDRLTVWDVVHGIRRAAIDDRVEALVLHVDGIDWGWAKIAEVRDALRAFRESGKPIFASVSGGGEAEYLLASVANRICMPPTAMLQLNGLTASAIFMRGAFDKFGLAPNFQHVGRYKSAVETYTDTGFSPSGRAALEAILDDEYALLVDSLASARRLSADSVRALLDMGPWDAAEARERGLVDTLLHDLDVDSLAARVGGKHLSSMSLSRYVWRLSESPTAARIAMVVASGTIAEGRSRESPTDGRIVGSETLIEALRDARERRSVRAIILRIDSPGGSSDASDDIWREVARCRARKPVVVSMSDLAASGGYYIAMGGTPILAQPSTLTGSIGVYGGKLDIRGLFAKLGLSVESLSRGPHAQMLSPFESFTPEEKAIYQRHLDRFYATFLSRVAKSRGMGVEAVDSVAQGRVWTGLSARPRGLVDRFGGIEEAIAEARTRALIGRNADVVVDTYPRPEGSLFARAFAGLFNGGGTDQSLVDLPPVVQAWLAAARFPAGSGVALMPCLLEIR